MCADRGICLKKYELESLIKSFVLFFLLMTALYFLVATLNYRDRQQQLDERIFNEMRIFSFHPVGNKFEVDFEPKESIQDPARLHKGGHSVYGFFEIPGSKKYFMKLSLSLQQYQTLLEQIRQESYAGWILYIILIAVVSFLLALYTLYPIKRALELNEEFVRDILHDLNTPLSSLRIDLNILQKRFGEDRTIKRMLGALETIHAFQANLRAFLSRQEGREESLLLPKLLEESVERFRELYPDIEFELSVAPETQIQCNREAFLRILENLLSNAGKYNKPGGRVRITLKDSRLLVQDSGIGIRNPDKVFERYYKEGERGLGLGLHIVKKLAQELGISVSIDSHPGEGTTVILNLKNILESSE
jgi:two-component system OmpR family sensor kinase